jgi:hypothetical protein
MTHAKEFQGVNIIDGKPNHIPGTIVDAGKGLDHAKGVFQPDGAEFRY